MLSSPQSPNHASATPAFIAPGFTLAFGLVTSLFFMWAIANNMNDILIKQFQKALDLSRGQSGFIQFAFYMGYFFMALPAGMVMKKLGYKNGILIGLFLYALGALLFFPAAEVQQFGFFLFALFVIASGLTFLETAANPFITVMGDAKRAPQRLNLAQSFNGLGAAIAPVLGGIFIFSGVEYSAQELAQMSSEAVESYRTEEAKAVQVPYLILAVVVIIIAALTFIVKMPHIKAPGRSTAGSSMGALLREKNLMFAIIAQFFYVGAQVCIWSFFIDFCQDMAPTVNEKQAAYYLSLSLLCFMLGRFVGTALMSYISATRLLLIYALINALLCVVAATTTGWVAILAIGLTSPFMSIMFPTIFALGIKGLGEHTELGSSLIIMAIIGGALFPLAMGYIGDHSMNIAMLIPLVCFVVIAGFAKVQISNAHH